VVRWGGPLAPLANQLGHDRTYLQGQRIKSQMDWLSGLMGDPLALSVRAAEPAGWLLAEVRDPFALEVHRPVEPEAGLHGLPVLPEYVPRAHDTALAEVVRTTVGGRSEMAVLVGGSSTGKTRACWQALELLCGQQPGWRLWHPIDPSRPGAALRDLLAIGPRTVVWLNEAQFYLDTPDQTGEQVAAGLRELLRDVGRGPVLVLATLWPQFWDEMTSRPPRWPRSARPGAGAAGRARHHSARRVHCPPDPEAAPSSRPPAGRRGRSRGWACDPVPGRGTGSTGPLP
jgi:hypothetical protein